MTTIKIFVADDHPLFLKGLKDTLAEEADFETIGSALNGQEALRHIIRLQPDVAILDLDMPLMNGVEVAKTLLEKRTNIKIVILSMHKDADIIRAAMALGIHGYVFKDDAVNELVKAIRAVHTGKNYISVERAKKSFIVADTNALIGDLTKMEKAILSQIALQKTTKEIAEAHFISTRTVDNHRANIARKLNLKGNNSLLKFAINASEALKSV